MEINDEFDGVFRFSNNSDEDFTALWNNREYLFKAHTRSPMIIPNEPLENIQEIRKKWAFKWAEREWNKSKRYAEMNSKENYRGGRDDKELEPLIQMCLEPLPIVKAQVTEGKPEQVNVSEHTAAVSEDDNLNETFKDVVKEGKIRKLGKQSEKFNG